MSYLTVEDYSRYKDYKASKEPVPTAPGSVFSEWGATQFPIHYGQIPKHRFLTKEALEHGTVRYEAVVPRERSA